MNRYYILTERGVSVIEADGVKQLAPTQLRFFRRQGKASLDCSDVLWWNRVEPASTFEPFHSPFDAHPHQAPHGRDPNQQADFHQRSDAALNALVCVVSECVPRDWKKATLQLDVTSAFPGGTCTMHHSIRNPDTGAEFTDFSEALFVTSDVLRRISAERSEHWRRCTITLEVNDSSFVPAHEMRLAY